MDNSEVFSKDRNSAATNQVDFLIAAGDVLTSVAYSYSNVSTSTVATLADIVRLDGFADSARIWDIYDPTNLRPPPVSFFSSILPLGAGTHSITRSFASTASPPYSISWDFTLTFQVTGPTTSVPEPGTLSLLACGLLGLALSRRRRSSRSCAT